jgi:hypothetical protein
MAFSFLESGKIQMEHLFTALTPHHFPQSHTPKEVIYGIYAGTKYCCICNTSQNRLDCWKTHDPNNGGHFHEIAFDD